MTSNFSINHVFEEDLNINFTVNDGTFDTYGQTFILQHVNAIQNLKKLKSWNHVVLNEDSNNYFEVEYRWSFDITTWTPWVEMLDDFSNFLDPNTQENIWIQIKYKFITDNSKDIELKELYIYGDRKINEIFEPAVIGPGKSVIFTNQDTYKVFDLSDYKVFLKNTDVEADLEISIRYTQTQGRHWSEWIPLTAANLKTLKIERIKFCNFQFAFNNTGIGDINLYDLELIGEFQNVTANYKTIARLGLKTQCNPLLINVAPSDCSTTKTAEGCCQPCSQSLTPWNSDVENCSAYQSNYTQINDIKLWSNQINVYQQLNDFINQTNSWKITYFLTDADAKGIDHVLHEQQIHNIIAMKDINIVVPDNQFPVENVNYSGLDLDLIQSFEVHILKDSFKKTFGVEFRPSKRDVLYMCEMNQLWEVENMFPLRGFMLAENYYRVLLRKYNDRASRKFAKTEEGDEAKSFIDGITKYTDLDSLFNINVDNEIKRNTKDLLSITDEDNESQQYTQTTIIEVVSNMNTNVNIINHEIWNSTLTVAKTAYEMPIKSKTLKLVEYNTKDNNLELGDNRAISFWFKTDEYNPTYKWDIINNYDENASTGYKVEIFNGVMTLYINTNTYQLPISNMLDNVWYACLINMNQIKKEIELSIYSRQTENGIILSNSKLILFNKLIFTNIAPSAFTHNETVYIGGSDTFINTGNTNKWYITNIRLWNQVINSKNRSNVLNENVVTDANLTMIVDNAERKLNLPKYGNF